MISRIKYYLLDWKDQNMEEYISICGEKRLCDLSEEEGMNLFSIVTQKDLGNKKVECAGLHVEINKVFKIQNREVKILDISGNIVMYEYVDTGHNEQCLIGIFERVTGTTIQQ